MARARNIKPGFFTNDQLVELSFETRLLFIGLWTLADKAGRLEDRPKKIKMELFPADSIDVAPMLADLAKAGFISRYTVGEVACIVVNNWDKHQAPHHTERASTLPQPIVNGEVPVNSRSDLRGNPPDSGFLIPDSLIPDLLIHEKPAAFAAPKKGKPRTSIPEDFFPNEAGLADAVGLNVSVELAAFFNHHTSKGSLMADWQAAWRTWCGNARKFAKAASTLPAWREQQRAETQKAVPRIALGAVNPNTFFTELGASNVTALKLG